MQDYLKPTNRDFNPNIFILHVGTNNLPTNDSPEMIADKIDETAESIKKEDNNVVLLAIVPRGDKLNEKAEKVNSLLQKACNQKQIDLIMHSNINTKRHLNRSRLHLNGYGKPIFIRNIRNYLTNFNWQNLRDNTGTLSSSFSLNNTLLDYNLLKIKEQRLEYPTANIIGHLNINSLEINLIVLLKLLKTLTFFLFRNLNLIHHLQKSIQNKWL